MRGEVLCSFAGECEAQDLVGAHNAVGTSQTTRAAIVSVCRHLLPQPPVAAPMGALMTALCSALD